MSWRDRRIRWLFGVWLGVAVAWWILSTWVGPALIRAGYEERSLEIVNRAFSGRGQHDVGRYLAFWSSLTRWGWLLLVAAGVGLPLLPRCWRFLRPKVALLWEDPGLRPPGALVLGTWLGVALGLAEYLANRAWLAHLGAWSWWANPHQVWMLPLVNALVFGLAAALLCLALGGLWRRVSVMALFVPVTALGVFTLIRSLRNAGLHRLAAMVLALGIAVTLARLVSSRRDGFVRLVRRTTLPALGLFALLGVSLQGSRWLAERNGLRGLPAATAGAPNILLIVLDTVRSASLGLYGYERPTTPNLSRLASGAAVFDSAFATSSWTLPSHASLFTGRYHHEMSADFTSPLDGTHPTIAEVLTEAGYATGGFVANFHYTSRWSGLDRGFLRYEDFPVSFAVAFHSGWLSHAIASRIMRRIDPKQDPLSRKFAEDVNREFLDWQSGIGDRPFFAFLNYFDAHNPYIMFEEHWSRFPAERPAMPPDVPEERLEDAIDRYDTSIAHMDQRISDLMATLDDRGALDNTIVVVVSDHGEHFGENGLKGHGRALYAPGVHVPLLVWAPERVPAGRVGAPVSIRDVGATLLELTGADPGRSFPGLTLARHWRAGSDAAGSGGDGLDAGPGGDGPDAAPELVLMENNPNPLNLDPDFPVSHGPLKSLVSRRFQYIRHLDGREELYDVGVDRWQSTNLAETDLGRPELDRFRDELSARGLIQETPLAARLER